MLHRNFIFRYFIYSLFGLLMIAFTPARGGMSISSSTSLDTFNYDLDNLHLKLEKLDAHWQFSPFGEGQLTVEKMRAKRLIITIGDGTARSSETGLPERIKPPFPIKLQQAEVAEVLIIKNGETQIYSHVKFDLDANAKTIKFNFLSADTPWGKAAATLQMGASKPFPLSGTISVKKAETSTLKNAAPTLNYDVKFELTGDLQTLNFASTSLLTKQNGQFAINQSQQANVISAAQIKLTGQIGLTGDYPLSATIAINELKPERLFNPSQQQNFPASKLNFNLTLQGKLLPKLESTLQFSAQDSQWQDQALNSNGKIFIEDNQIRHIDFQANVANNIIKANGSLGQANSKLNWQADLADLSKLGSGYSGKANANGTVIGALDNLALQFNIIAEKLNLPGGFNTEKLEGQATINAGANGKLDGAFKANNLQYGKYTLNNGSLMLTGTQAKHQLSITAQDKAFKFNSTFAGGLEPDTNRWQGLLQSLNLEGANPIKLSAPAPFVVDSNGVAIEKLKLQLANGQLIIDILKLGTDGFSSMGSATQIALEDLPQTLFTLPTTLQGNPVFSGKWDLKATDSVNGNFSLWREAGDFTLTTADGKTQTLGLEEVSLSADFLNNAATAQVKLTGKNIGSLEAQFSTALTKIDSSFALITNAPLMLKGKAQLHSLAWLPLPPPLMEASFDGAIDVSVAANGTVGEPNLSGYVNGKNLQLNLPTEGVDFKNGRLEATFENKQLLIKKASWQGGDGTINITGSVLFDKSKPTIDLDWVADKFTAISRADRLLTLNGTGKTSLLNDMLTISGNFSIDKGLVELADEDTPALGDDVVVLGQTEIAPESALRILLNGLRIDLGKDFTLRGRGLDAELTGALTFTGLTQYRPHTEGVIQVKKGTYMAYGQVLAIERGIINFNGTVDNPGLNIRAMRNSKPINAGIEITGTAFIPITKLVSDPSVADSEKLSWLVLGHGMDQTTKNDYGLLSLAAGVLLSQGQSVPLQTQLARAAGLDEFSFAGGDATSASVVFGKRLTSNLYLSYQKSISGLLDVARLTFNITSRWSLRAEAGTESAVDVLYTFSFK